MAMAVGVILAATWPDAGVLKMLAAASAGMLSGVIAFRGHTDYLCCSGVPLFSLVGLQQDNFLVRVGGGGSWSPVAKLRSVFPDQSGEPA